MKRLVGSSGYPVFAMERSQSKEQAYGLCIIVWVLGVLSFGGVLVDLPVARAEQQTVEEVPDTMSPIDNAEGDMAEPRSDAQPSRSPRPRRLPPALRPKVLTPEELAEAEYNRKLAAKYGTDPTAIVGRVQLSSQYVDLLNGSRLVDNQARVDLAFKGNYLLRADMPFVRWLDQSSQNVGSPRGLSDVALTAAWRAYNTPQYAILLGMTSAFPTANEPTLGSGKYSLGPFIATGRFIPSLDSFVFGLFQHLTSVGGDPSRGDVGLTKAIVQVNTIWGSWWTVAQSILLVNWERDQKTGMTLEFEVGRNVVGRWGVFVRPGVGIWGRDLAGIYEWSIEVGVRRTFPSF
ncbi:hypothetical protein [Nitrospira sp. BLG_2]|uniref:hypothetical protein n=1 Tax=Nitrospira sp. BLG_2 TaxID=3397507 RepID=UPI003B9A185F